MQLCIAFPIIIIYVLLGSLITGIFGAEALNELSTSVTFNVIFFALLVVFLSFLGAFEIVYQVLGLQKLGLTNR